MVIPTANVPHGLRSKAPKTTIERPAIVIVIINSIARPVQKPAIGPSSSFITSDKDLPPWRIEANNTTASWTAPPMTAPINNHRRPGK